MAGSWCSSELKVKKFSFKWTVKDFESIWASESLPLKSPPFPCAFESSFFSKRHHGGVKNVHSAADFLNYSMITGDGKRREGATSAKEPDLVVDTKWQLLLNPPRRSGTRQGQRDPGVIIPALTTSTGHVGPADDKIEVELYVASNYHVKMKCVISLLNEVGTIKYSKKSQMFDMSTGYGSQMFDMSTGYKYSMRIPDFITFTEIKSKRGEILPDGALRVHCEIVAYGQVIHTPVRTRGKYAKYVQVPPVDPTLGPYMESARKDGFLTDFTLVVGEKAFSVHKVVLAARSSVFRRMIETEMRESQDKRTTISDFTPEVVEELLSYLYTGTTPNLEKMPQDLLQIADKYDISHLKALCEEALCNNLDVSNATSTLLLADLHSAQQLRSACISFIVDHVAELKTTKDWGAFKTKFPDVYLQVLEASTQIS